MAKAGIVYTLAKCGNLFWTIYCLFLAIMTFVISDEPLFFFHQNHPSEYVAPPSPRPTPRVELHPAERERERERERESAAALRQLVAPQSTQRAC